VLLAGLVWERVSGVTKAPLDNKACLFAAMSKVMLIMKDTLREVGSASWNMMPGAAGCLSLHTCCVFMLVDTHVRIV
jgi:hypothetical protein